MNNNQKKMIANDAQEDSQLQLWECIIDSKKEYELIVNGVFIMASYNGLSSELLVRNSVKKLNLSDSNILIGGLGMGYSVKEACKYRKELKEIHVVEIEPQIIKWNKELLSDLNGKYLTDERVSVINDDFYQYVYSTNVNYNIVCMDIDNGPMMLSSENNIKVYSLDFFRQVKKILMDEALFVIWSCNEDSTLLSNLRKVFPNCWVEEVMENHQGTDIAYYLYFTANF